MQTLLSSVIIITCFISSDTGYTVSTVQWDSFYPCNFTSQCVKKTSKKKVPVELSAILIALCKRVYYPKPIYKKINSNHNLAAHHLNIISTFHQNDCHMSSTNQCKVLIYNHDSHLAHCPHLMSRGHHCTNLLLSIVWPGILIGVIMGRISSL